MSFGRHLANEYMRHRLYGGRHHRPSPWGMRRAPSHGYWMRSSRHGPFGRPRPRGGVQVRGCGCCLPIPLGVGALVALLGRVLWARADRRG